MPLVKNVFVRIKVDGAERAKADLGEIAARARMITNMDPTIKVKVDPEALHQLHGMQLELRALAAAGDSAGLKNLGLRLRALGDGAEAPRVKLRALALEMEALKRAAASDAASIDGGGGLLGALRRLFSKGGGISTAAGGIPGIPAGLPVPLIIAGLLAGLGALPFIAQAAAGAITLGLGGALTGLGVYAEMGTRKVQYQFAQLMTGKNGIQATLKGISPAFGQALATILNGARTFVPQFIRDFKPALDAIAGPLKSIGVMLEGVFANKQVADSIQAVGQAFGSILKALTPQLPGDIAAIADGITNVARAVSKNPKAIADMISGLLHLAGVALDVIAWLTQVAAYLELHFIPAWQRTLKFFEQWRHDVVKEWTGVWHDATKWFDRILHDVTHYWDMTWQNTIGRLRRGVNDTNRYLNGWLLDIVHWFETGRHDIAAAWNATWDNTIGRLSRGVNDANQWLGRLAHDFAHWFDVARHTAATVMDSLPGLLFRAGQNAIHGLVSGFGSLVSWAKNLLGGWAHDIASAITAPFGIHLSEPSEAAVMIKAGQQIPRGLATGMRAGLPELAMTAGLTGRAAMPYGGAMIGAAGGGVLRLEVVGHGGGMLDQLFITWLRNYVRVAGGGGPQSAQRALGVVWR